MVLWDVILVPSDGSDDKERVHKVHFEDTENRTEYILMLEMTLTILRGRVFILRECVTVDTSAQMNVIRKLLVAHKPQSAGDLQGCVYMISVIYI